MTGVQARSTAMPRMFQAIVTKGHYSIYASAGARTEIPGCSLSTVIAANARFAGKAGAYTGE